ncbi:putative nucleotidyltransferase [Nitrobacteraceae bacterium AZCC 1564]
MHIYAFGSVCRGDVSLTSDIDLLAIVDGHDGRFNADDYSIYSYQRIQQIWDEGNPFAWHLASESRLLFASDQADYLKSLNEPRRYKKAAEDCERFFSLFIEAKGSLETNTATLAFDLSMVFLAIRNFATCFSLGCLQTPDFSRKSAIRIGRYSLPIEQKAFDTLERARILCTRGIGLPINAHEASFVIERFPNIESWMDRLLKEVKH